MALWQDFKLSRAERLVRQADGYLRDLCNFHKKFDHTREDAIAKCKKAVRLRPDYALAYLVLANALNEEETRGEAVVAYRRAIEIDPGLYWAHVNLAGVLLLKGELAQTDDKEESRQLLEEAVLEFKTAFAIKQGDRQQRRYLSQALMFLGRQDEANQIIEELEKQI